MAQNSNIDEKKLLLELSQGSELAFTNIYNRYKNNVYATALRITKSKIQAEEAVQDVFLKIWQNRENIAEVIDFENYLFIISRNHLFNSIKKIAKETSQITEIDRKEAGFIDTDITIKDEQYNTILNQIVEQLPPQQQKVYQMAKRDGLSHQKIGEDLGISTETVKKHMAQALKFIRLKISPYMNMFMSLLLFFKL
ncbi:RNA polymerase sigma-70 factor (ECF subfamily) [Flavobacterium nitrogenifigens]|uniref:RNA polymerase sigma-70 factor (ECF subfamily) n=2 Tax=Flavobacterium TaxID=237 RepID=A0A7W7IW28_9FLAO|nr:MULTISPECIES: RNA polymerase sigma-70 factor [Flavobacterium]MBB4801638.1 RNA polymerase sigma-70 factor (ECF subfamily) [Flavobacterium nitrogenifigens]MBB6386596.1 RNA polymerase sigma-70 factor (ECF subfamily) [Flavobacterium notoginsengisoli]